MLIGITGTDGAGKGTVVKYLVKHHSFTHYPARNILIVELEKEGRGSTRVDLRLKGNEMRATHGNDFMVSYNLKQIKEDKAERAIIESIRTVAEAETLKKHGGILLAVDAEKHIRFERVQARRLGSDKVTFKEFVEQEELELHDPNPHGMQKRRVMSMADHTILNDNDEEKLYEEIEQFMKEILHTTTK